MSEIKEYKINVQVKGYDLYLDMKVPAKDPDEAFDLACSKEFRYEEEDPYVLLVTNKKGINSVLCTYQTLKEGNVHCDTITSGKWMLVKKDDEGGMIIRTWRDDDEK